MIQVNQSNLIVRMAFSIKPCEGLIRKGDDVVGIAVNSVLQAVGKDAIEDGDVIGITEAVVATAQGNFATYQQIGKCVSKLYDVTKPLIIVDLMPSRNRGIPPLEGIMKSDVKRYYYTMTYPSDEVGNLLIPREDFFRIGDKGPLDLKRFTEIYGEPRHMYTGVNYPKMIEEIGGGKVNVLFCNDYTFLPSLGDQALVGNIHDRDMIVKILKNPGNGKKGMSTVYTLADIMKEPVDGSGSSEYGLYGSNRRHGDELKLMPKASQAIAERVQQVFFEKTGKTVEVIVFGDGCYKDAKSGIWELADPEPSLGATSRLKDLPTEIKLKELESRYPEKSSKEILEIAFKEKEEKKKQNFIGDMGTTPRPMEDLVASLFDLMVGSGDKGTPICYLKGYLD